jgi:hypothetical protein
MIDKKFITLIGLFLFLTVPQAFAVTSITSCCTDLNKAGETYILNNDISYNPSCFDCLQISNISVTLDCQGHSIAGTTLYGRNGIRINPVYTSINTNYTTIKNCKILNWYNAILGSDVFHSLFQNLYVNGSNQVGTGFAAFLMSGWYTFGGGNDTFENITTITHVAIYGDNNVFRNSKVYMAWDGVPSPYGTYTEFECGLNCSVYNNYFDDLSTPYYWGGFNVGNQSRVYNNIFNGTEIGFSTFFHCGAYYNTTKQLGIRIKSAGIYIGGNYWTNENGTGYSDTCNDTVGEGFCDIPYVPFSCSSYPCSGCVYTDYLPYSIHFISPISQPCLVCDYSQFPNKSDPAVYMFTGMCLFVNLIVCNARLFVLMFVAILFLGIFLMFKKKLIG